MVRVTRGAKAFPLLRLVCFDVDGTLNLGHGWGPVAAFRGRRREFVTAQREFRRGATSEDQHLERLLDLAEGMRLSEMEGVLERSPHLAHLSEMVDALHARGVLVALLTHNPGYVCQWYARKYGLDLYAGVAQRVVGGRIQRAGPMHVDKREGLRLLLQATGVPARLTAHVGDGMADARVFPCVGTAIALNSSLPEVRRAADRALRTRDAQELLPLLRRPYRTRVLRLPPRRRADPGSFRRVWTQKVPPAGR